MTEEEKIEHLKSVNALLVVACSRFLNAASEINAMREMLRQNNVDAFWEHNITAAEHLYVGGREMVEADRIMLAINSPEVSVRKETVN